jgi:hypothetical protein
LEAPFAIANGEKILGQRYDENNRCRRALPTPATIHARDILRILGIARLTLLRSHLPSHRPVRRGCSREALRWQGGLGANKPPRWSAERRASPGAQTVKASLRGDARTYVTGPLLKRVPMHPSAFRRSASLFL